MLGSLVNQGSGAAGIKEIRREKGDATGKGTQFSIVDGMPCTRWCGDFTEMQALEKGGFQPINVPLDWLRQSLDLALRAAEKGVAGRSRNLLKEHSQ